MRVQLGIPVVVGNKTKWLLVKTPHSSEAPAKEALKKVKELGFTVDEGKNFAIIDAVIDME